MFSAASGVVLIRVRRSDEIAELASTALTEHPNMSGLFVVAEPGRPPRATKIV